MTVRKRWSAMNREERRDEVTRFAVFTLAGFACSGSLALVVHFVLRWW